MTHQNYYSIGKALLLSLVICMPALQSNAGPVKRLSDPIESDATSETYGARFVVKGETLRLKEAMKKDECEKDKAVTVKTQVSEVCQAKGCFFIAQDEELMTRVTFKDYGCFVPTNISGHEVVMNAVLSPRELTPEEAAHINADLGAGKTVAAGQVCELTAHSVKVLN